MGRHPRTAASTFLTLAMAFALLIPAHAAVVHPVATGVVGDAATGSGILAIAPERPSAPPDQPLGRAVAARIPPPSAQRRIRPVPCRAPRRTPGTRDAVSLRAPPGPGRATVP
ncbi:hypothetical protein [Pseudonocardia sp.]|uniref:hypothetical protein n=1 Tax=Pseudonocardia sp. TaxID=60912 RepID=UPI003D14AF3B